MLRRADLDLDSVKLCKMETSESLSTAEMSDEDNEILLDAGSFYEAKETKSSSRTRSDLILNLTALIARLK